MWKTVAPILSRSCLFLAGAAMALSTASAVETDKKRKLRKEHAARAVKLSLRTDKLFQRLNITDSRLPAHRIGLDISLDDKGGKGTLVSDLNPFFTQSTEAQSCPSRP